ALGEHARSGKDALTLLVAEHAAARDELDGGYEPVALFEQVAKARMPGARRRVIRGGKGRHARHQLPSRCSASVSASCGLASLGRNQTASSDGHLRSELDGVLFEAEKDDMLVTSSRRAAAPRCLLHVDWRRSGATRQHRATATSDLSSTACYSRRKRTTCSSPAPVALQRLGVCFMWIGVARAQPDSIERRPPPI